MLTKQDLYFNSKFCCLLCKLNIVPLTFNSLSGKLAFQGSKVRLGVWKLQIVLLLGFSISYRAFRLVQSLAQPSDYFKLQWFSFNFIYLMGTWMTFATCLNAYLGKGRDLALLFNELHGSQPSETAENIRGTTAIVALRGLLRPRRSIWEVIIGLFPLSLTTSIVGVCVLYLVEYRANFLFYSVVPEAQKSPLIFVAVMAVEFLVLVQATSPMYLGFYEIISLFPDLEERVFSQIRGTCTNVRAVSHGTTLLIQTQLSIRILNHAFSDFIFMFKLYCLSGSIGSIFVGIKFHKESPHFAAISVLLGLYVMFLFITLLGQMYKVPREVTSSRKGVNKLLKKGAETDRFHKALTKRLQAVSQCEVRVSDFYTVDRMSSPNFIDFVFSQVCSLLLTWK